MFKIEYFRYFTESKWDLRWFFRPIFFFYCIGPLQGSDADTPNKTPGGARKTATVASTASASATTVGNTFFGPDFSPEAVLRGDGSQGRTMTFQFEAKVLETKEAQFEDL